MSDASRHEADRASRLARAAMVRGLGGKICPAESATSLLEAVIEPSDRVAVEGDNQKQADFLALRPRDGGSGADARSAYRAVRAGIARTSRGVRARHREPPRFRLRGTAEPQARRPRRGEDAQDRRDPYLSRALRAHARGPDAASRADRCRQGRSRWQSLYRPEYRGYAHDRRGSRVPRRHRRGAGQRDRGPVTPGRCSWRLGRFRGP